MAVQTAFICSDDKIFSNLADAEKHEATLIDYDKLTVELKEDLNRILIKLSAVPSAVVVNADQYNKHVPEGKDRFARLIKTYLNRVLNDKYDYDAEHYETQYYTSKATFENGGC